MRYLLTAAILLLLAETAKAQLVCTAPGQNPATAFPVCGTSTFTQESVPICGGKNIPTPTCTAGILTDVNPFWYKFTCFQSGTLGFSIKPHTNSEDYDWQVFDITNQDPDDVYTNINLAVAANWSGEGGETGASAAGTQLFICEGFGKPLWSKMPQLQQGHEYLLLVSHFTQTQSGYDLSFGGGTAIITDSTPPELKFAEASCGGDMVRIKLNKKMKCSSIAGDGSDFFITPGNIPITSATGIGCAAGFDSDSILLQLSTFLSPGTYTVNVKNGTDGNTLLDYCDKPLPTTENSEFTVESAAPTPMDSLAPVACKIQQLRLVFSRSILCSSVAGNGSDFEISGSYPVTISGAQASCPNGSTLSKEILVTLSQPLFNAGTFTLRLKTGTDGNTLLDECGRETPAGSELTFSVKDTVNADFSFQKKYGCINDTVNFYHPGGNGVNSWQWELDDSKTSILQNPEVLYQQFNTKTVQLAVSNGFCVDTSSMEVVLDNFLKADFTTFDDNCPNEPVSFISNAEGNVKVHHWNFGDGGQSSDESPSHTYTSPHTTTPYTVSYTVRDSLGCEKTVQKIIKIYSSCFLAVPTGFTPNNDGLNDFLYPLNAVKAENLEFRVYNRWGQMVFLTRNWKQGWDGTLKGKPQGADVYVWYLSYVDRDTKEPRQMKGTVMLIR